MTHENQSFVRQKSDGYKFEPNVPNVDLALTMSTLTNVMDWIVTKQEMKISRTWTKLRTLTTVRHWIEMATEHVLRLMCFDDVDDDVAAVGSTWHHSAVRVV
jgi:hypothetical protein